MWHWQAQSSEPKEITDLWHGEELLNDVPLLNWVHNVLNMPGVKPFRLYHAVPHLRLGHRQTLAFHFRVVSAQTEGSYLILTNLKYAELIWITLVRRTCPMWDSCARLSWSRSSKSSWWILLSSRTKQYEAMRSNEDLPKTCHRLHHRLHHEAFLARLPRCDAVRTLVLARLPCASKVSPLPRPRRTSSSSPQMFNDMQRIWMWRLWRLWSDTLITGYN